MAILIDASIICALANVRDIHHKRAIKIIQDIVAGKYGTGIVTDYIFDEIVTVAMRKTNKQTAIEFGHYLLNSEILLARIDRTVFDSAWKLFHNKYDFSFTDCTSVAFVQLFGIKSIATFDKAFKNLTDLQIVDN